MTKTHTMSDGQNSLSISAGQHSLAGVKPQNEDACGIHLPTGSLLATKGIAIVIADGMSDDGTREILRQFCIRHPDYG